MDLIQPFNQRAEELAESRRNWSRTSDAENEAIRLDELKKFARSFHLSTLIPSDILDIVAGPDPQRQIFLAQKSRRDALEYVSQMVNIALDGPKGASPIPGQFAPSHILAREVPLGEDGGTSTVLDSTHGSDYHKTFTSQSKTASTALTRPSLSSQHSKPAWGTQVQYPEERLAALMEDHELEEHGAPVSAPHLSMRSWR